MVDPITFHNALAQSGIDFYTGVPDSMLRPFCACVAEHTKKERHIIAANEGAAIGLAAGSYLASGRPALVYMQNSGLGNAINPLLSLADMSVYGIPMILMIGWRGEPGVKDEPQHVAQGQATTSLLNAIGVEHYQLPNDTAEATTMLNELRKQTIKDNKPVAVLVSKNTFADYHADENDDEPVTLSRERAIELILNQIKPDSSVVSSTGMISRELYELRDHFKQNHDTDFLTVGSMGHCSQIALGIANTIGWNSMVQFEIVYADSGCDGTTAATAAQTLVDAGVVGVVGAACSGASMGANAVLSAAGVPQISYASTSPALSDATAYPDFFRVVPSDALQGQALSAVVKVDMPADGTVGLVHMTNDYGAGLADSFADDLPF